MSIQKRIENYWEGEASQYSESVWKEINSFKRQAWTDLIEEYRPPGSSLEVLDIGTGPGFFAVVLTGMGHQVTAVDCSENMLAEARTNVEKVGLKARFGQMDSHILSFADNSFDLLLCRNLTWTLHEPETAYREWYRVLKPGGRLLIFDANWNLRLNDPEMQKKYEEDREHAAKLDIKRQGHVDQAEGDRISKMLFFSSQLRPRWDAAAFLDIGFRKIFIDRDLTERVWDDSEKALYRSTPMFLAGAEK